MITALGFAIDQGCTVELASVLCGCLKVGKIYETHLCGLGLGMQGTYILWDSDSDFGVRIFRAPDSEKTWTPTPGLTV